jgi:predicted enzyme related to lactoylglutathione lyase
MQIKLTSIYVDSHDKALKFYVDVLGLQKKADFGNNGYRWLTVNSPEDPNGPELQLELNANPAAKAYQEAMFTQGQPALLLHTKDVKADYERVKAKGGEFIMPPTDVTASIIAQVNDTCGNIIQFVQLNW